MTSHPASAKLTGTDLLIAAVMVLMWGLNLVAVKEGVDRVSPMTAALIRQFMVLIICLPMLRVLPGRMRDLIALGVLSGVLFYIFTNLSMAVSTNISALAIAGQLGVPFALALAVIFQGERIHIIRITGMVLAFLGVALIVFDPSAGNEKIGLMLTAAASLVWAICSLFQRRLIGVPVLTIYAWVGLCGTLGLLPIALIAEPEQMAHLPDIPLSSFGWLLFSAAGSTVIGQGAMSLLLQRHPVTTVMPLTLLTPVISVIAASFWFGTPLTPVMIVGGLIVMTGIAIVTLRTPWAKDAGLAK